MKYSNNSKQEPFWEAETARSIPAAIAARQASINRIVAEIAAMPILDARPPREINDDLNALMIVVDSSALIAILFGTT